MATTKAGNNSKFAGRDQILAGYRESEVEISGTDTLRIRYKPPSARSMLKMQELGQLAEDAENDAEKAERSWVRLAEMVSDHLVDEEGAKLCEAEELMDAPMDTVLAIIRAITPTVQAGADEVSAQGEG